MFAQHAEGYQSRKPREVNSRAIRLQRSAVQREPEGRTGSDLKDSHRTNEEHTATSLSTAKRLRAVEAGAQLIHSYNIHCDTLMQFYV